ncbi:MAG TPA: universal stress protein, partial [Pirellulales bacterium]
MRLHTILVPTDFSPAAQAALDHAVSLARSKHAAILLLHVVDPMPAIGSHQVFSTELQQSIEAAADRVRPALDAIEVDAEVVVERLMLVGNPADQIVAIAAQHDVDLVVIGASTRTARTRKGSEGTAAA